jgi:hypothetical protein
MTSRERVTAAFTHQEPDRTPVFEYVLLSPVASSILGQPYEDYGGDVDVWFTFADEQGGYEKALRYYAACRAELAARLEHDLIYCVPNPPRDLRDRKKTEIPYAGNDPVEAVQYSIRLRERDLEGPPPDIRVYSYIREELGKRGLDLPIYAPAFIHGIWTNTDLMQTMALDPDTAHEYFGQCTRIALRQIEGYLQDGIEIIGVGGDFAGNSPLISPAMYREFIMPEIKKLTDIIRKNGAYSVNASDGMLWDVLDCFLTGAGVDAYGEIDAGAGMDLKKLKNQYGNHITLFGNMDCGNLLSFGSPEEIRNTTVRCIEDGLGRGGHIFTASNAITASVPLTNYLAMVSAYRDFFHLPALKIPQD